MFTKMLTGRLSKVITTLIDIDQTGFIPAKSTDTNLRRLFANLQIAYPTQGLEWWSPFDIEKAFDSVDWTYTTSVLKCMGSGFQFMAWISLL